MIRSEQFDDIYFSAEGGLAETEHVFLKGNHLPHAWAGKPRFCIAETGFGTGLNMLAAWKLFDETAEPEQRLDLISVEKYPLGRAEIAKALQDWRAPLGKYLDRLLDVYPLRVRGYHRLDLSPRVSLTLVFDDALVALPQISATVDAWFLDGFAPAKNPDMWHPDLYAQMARLSAHGASIATFTAAGDVRRGLAAAGFAVEKTRGFGRKRDMVVGRYEGAGAARCAPVQRVAVIGAGLAGLSAAWHLQREGCEVTVYEAGASIGAGASGNSAGLINPKLTAQPSAQADYYTAAYAYALGLLKFLPGVDFSAHGSLHLQTDDDKARRFSAYCANLGWGAAHMVPLSAQDASDAAGVAMACGGLFYPDAAVASPRGICAALAQGLTIRLNHAVDALENLDADAVVVATAAAVKDLPVNPVRGQVTQLAPNDASAKIKTNLCYGGYVTPVLGSGMHMCGATFQPWEKDPGTRDEDDARNIAGLLAAVPSLGDGLKPGGHWAGFRAASKDRFPLIGGEGRVFHSVAHGSHGMISALMGGRLLAAKLCGGVMPLGIPAIKALAPSRFAIARTDDET